MLKLYDLLFYCFYCLVIKRANDQSHVRAIMLQGLVLTNFLICIFLNVYYLYYKHHILKALIITVFIVVPMNLLVDKLENKFYIDNEKYLFAIRRFDKYFTNNQKKILALFALLLILFSKGLFIYTGIKIGKETSSKF